LPTVTIPTNPFTVPTNPFTIPTITVPTIPTIVTKPYNSNFPTVTFPGV